MADPQTFDPNVAHIKDGEIVFQVMNAEGTDWDETATRALYDQWKAQQ